jgi:hypothetical protein
MILAAPINPFSPKPYQAGPFSELFSTLDLDPLA